MLLVANLVNMKWWKKLRNDRNPGKWVLIWEYSARVLQWIPIWQGLDDFRNSLLFCTLDERNLTIRRVNAPDVDGQISTKSNWISHFYLVSEQLFTECLTYFHMKLCAHPYKTDPSGNTLSILWQHSFMSKYVKQTFLAILWQHDFCSGITMETTLVTASLPLATLWWHIWRMSHS